MTASPTASTGAKVSARPAKDKPAIIACAGLTKTFRDFWMRSRVKAVDNIDFNVKQGEVFGLLGPNGSGKSTTIKMILGLLKPTSGQIAVFGHPPEDVGTKTRIGYLPEESYLYRFLNARETLDYYGRLFHQKREQRQGRTEELLKMVGLQAAARRPVGEYSKGMQRRIGLAQALINDPDLLILDEPTTGMDPIATRSMKDLILKLKDRGKTILLCSHLLQDVEDVCDRVSVMYGGKVRRLGTMDELLLKQEITTITTESLDEDTINRIDELLATRGRSVQNVSHPRQKLEELFLDIVEEAQREGRATSGARGDGKMADFLAGAAASEGDSLVDELVSKGTESVTPTEPVAAAPVAPAEPEVVVPEELLQPAEPAQDDFPPPKPAEPPKYAPDPKPEPKKPADPNSEQPDQSFIDALMDVPPYEEGDGNGKKRGK
jgi:ABC-2 type transport system ATP-binding protein